jgi:predicted HNH restriction endonuclease
MISLRPAIAFDLAGRRRAEIAVNDGSPREHSSGKLEPCAISAARKTCLASSKASSPPTASLVAPSATSLPGRPSDGISSDADSVLMPSNLGDFMPKEKDKKIPAISWEQIVLEAIFALTDGNSNVAVTTEEMYKWIESTEYLTTYGRQPDPNWMEDSPSYRASLQLRWQRMVSAGKITREKSGVYRLAQSQIVSPQTKWEQMLETDQEVTELTVKQVVTKKVQRSQKLRDLLVNYYDARCQVCETDSPFLIPTEIPGRFYVEVHHVKGLAEAYALQQGGLLVGMKVNGLENLTVLCPHHHAAIHHHSPAFQFERNNLLWRHTKGGILPIRNISDEHAALLQEAA